MTDRPFTEAQEIVGGHWVIDVRSKEEAVAWATRAPVYDGDVIELRPVFEMAALAEDLAQDARPQALEGWPQSGVPGNPGAWLMATAKNRAIDLMGGNQTLARKQQELARDIEIELDGAGVPDLDAALDDEVGDDLLSLVFTTRSTRRRRGSR